MRRRWLPVLLVPALLVALAACGDDGGGTPTTTPLDGLTFQVTGVTGQALVPQSAISVTFDAGNLLVAAGCNTRTAPYQLQDDHLVLTSELAGTLAACEDPLQAQDEWVAELLSSEPEVTIAGDQLTITGDDVRLELSTGT